MFCSIRINDPLILRFLYYNNNLQVKTLFIEEKTANFLGTLFAKLE